MQQTESKTNCLFCKIIAGQIVSDLLVDNDFCIVIKDINPQAPKHMLVIPKVHVPDITRLHDLNLLGKLFSQASELAIENGMDNGFRLVVNTGVEGGQTVDHLHIHVLAGRSMGWPPG